MLNVKRISQRVQNEYANISGLYEIERERDRRPEVNPNEFNCDSFFMLSLCAMNLTFITNFL
jgi:hypothetical protein